MPETSNNATAETNSAASQTGQRAERIQPWKEFVQISQSKPMAFVGENKNIRMKEGRVDGKDIGG